MISFVVHSVPVAQPRQRMRVVQSRGRVFTHSYTPTKSPVNAFKASVQMAAAIAYGGPLLDGPLSLELKFILPRPKSMTKKRSDNAREWDSRSRNDWDNLAKSVCDALNGILWHDDGQIACVSVWRMIAAADEQPRVLIDVETIV